jgi:hypothetical protein
MQLIKPSTRNMMKAMGITADILQESDTCFHGIIPTLPAYSVGKLSLDVVFGKPNTSRRERLEILVHSTTLSSGGQLMPNLWQYLITHT